MVYKYCIGYINIYICICSISSCITIADKLFIVYISYIMEDKNLDAHKQRIDPQVWLKMKLSAMKQGKKIHQWLQEAILLKLQNEESDEK